MNEERERNDELLLVAVDQRRAEKIERREKWNNVQHGWRKKDEIDRDNDTEEQHRQHFPPTLPTNFQRPTNTTSSLPLPSLSLLSSLSFVARRGLVECFHQWNDWFSWSDQRRWRKENTPIGSHWKDDSVKVLLTNREPSFSSSRSDDDDDDANFSRWLNLQRLGMNLLLMINPIFLWTRRWILSQVWMSMQWNSCLPLDHHHHLPSPRHSHPKHRLHRLFCPKLRPRRRSLLDMNNKRLNLLLPSPPPPARGTMNNRWTRISWTKRVVLSLCSSLWVRLECVVFTVGSVGKGLAGNVGGSGYVVKEKKVIVKRDIIRKKEPVNIIFCGHVDAGKSTIGGQLMSVLLSLSLSALWVNVSLSLSSGSWRVKWINERWRSIRTKRGRSLESLGICLGRWTPMKKKERKERPWKLDEHGSKRKRNISSFSTPRDTNVSFPIWSEEQHKRTLPFSFVLISLSPLLSSLSLSLSLCRWSLPGRVNSRQVSSVVVKLVNMRCWWKPREWDIWSFWSTRWMIPPSVGNKTDTKKSKRN